MQSTIHFRSDDLTFVASAILTGKITIAKVQFHPQKTGVKVYYLIPYRIAEKIHLDYISDQLKISPQLLSSKIAAIRHLQAELPLKEGKLNGK